MLRQISRVLRACLALTVLGAGLIVGTAGTAAASTDEPVPSWTETFDIQFGDKGEDIGSATVSRYDGPNEDTIVVEYTVPGGYTESHLCESDRAFTEKIEPGQCQQSNLDPQGATGSYTVMVDPGEVVYLQLHIATQGETAYMGWVHGSPSYGNVKVSNVVTCPDGYTAPDGDMVDADDNGVAENCDFIPVEADCPEGLVVRDGEVAMDDDGDGDADNCVAPQIVVNCPVGQTMVDGVCQTPSVPDPAVLPETVTPAPATPAEPATPAVPAEPAPSVLPDAGTPTVIPVAAPAPAVAETAVLGAQVQRAPLARTGSSTTGLAAFGALLVLLGASASIAGRRTARSC